MPLGHAGLDDTYLTAALAQPHAPFTARYYARRALSEYDLALIGTTDPGVYAGRAAALDLLGAVQDAVCQLLIVRESDAHGSTFGVRIAPSPSSMSWSARA